MGSRAMSFAMACTTLTSILLSSFSKPAQAASCQATVCTAGEMCYVFFEESSKTHTVQCRRCTPGDGTFTKGCFCGATNYNSDSNFTVGLWCPEAYCYIGRNESTNATFPAGKNGDEDWRNRSLHDITGVANACIDYYKEPGATGSPSHGARSLPGGSVLAACVLVWGAVLWGLR